MHDRKDLIKIFLAYAFVLALLLPTTVQFVHALEGHDTHTVCTDFKTHIHKKKLNCPICAFHFSTFSYTTTGFPDFIKFETNYKNESTYSFHESTSTPFHYLLRGPPTFS
jgi:hypothetical protein